MEQILLDMFEQARKLVVETDRRLAEENDRIREKEREAKIVAHPALTQMQNVGCRMQSAE